MPTAAYTTLIPHFLHILCLISNITVCKLFLVHDYYIPVTLDEIQIMINDYSGVLLSEV